MKVLELKKILETIPEDSILISNTNGLTILVTTDFEKNIKHIYHGMLIGMKESKLIWVNIDKEL